MSSNLVKRLRPLSWSDVDAWFRVPIDETMLEAADRIEELEAKLAKAVEALVSLEKQSSITSSRGAACGPHWTQLSISILNARATLAELRGGDA